MSEQKPPYDEKVIMFSCSGAANVGEIADEALRRLMFEGKGEMSCVDGVGARLDKFLEKTNAAETVVMVDGCDNECGRKLMEGCGFSDFKYLRVVDLGVEKAKPKRAMESEISKVKEHIQSLL